MARELLNKLPSGAVHIELPVSLDVEYFSSELYYRGRVTLRKCIIPDVVIINPDTLEPSFIAEFRFTPVYWGFYHLLCALEEKIEEKIEPDVVKVLKRDINLLRQCREHGPTESELKKGYMRKVDIFIRILSDFESKASKRVTGYLCVLDEFHPDIKGILQKAIDKHSPPNQFKLLTAHIPIVDSLEQIVAKLERR